MLLCADRVCRSIHAFRSMIIIISSSRCARTRVRVRLECAPYWLIYFVFSW
jgi:hypothetical protein